MINQKVQERSLQVKEIIGSPVTALPFTAQIEIILDWAKDYRGKYVCVANVHMLVEAYWHPEFASVLKRADLVTPDGMPLVWMIKALGGHNQNRVAGMDIFLSLCQRAAQDNLKVFFLGSHKAILDQMRVRLIREFPKLQIAGMEPLPFGSLSLLESDELVQRIHESQAHLIFISLGCPKQEYWMSRHKHKISAVMIGLGGVFPVYAGIHKRAPQWMQDLGLEWAFRLAQEPKRLWKRYWRTNSIFIFLALRQIFMLFISQINTFSVQHKWRN